MNRETLILLLRRWIKEADPALELWQEDKAEKLASRILAALPNPAPKRRSKKLLDQSAASHS